MNQLLLDFPDLLNQFNFQRDKIVQCIECKGWTFGGKCRDCNIICLQPLDYGEIHIRGTVISYKWACIDRDTIRLKDLDENDWFYNSFWIYYSPRVLRANYE